MDQKITTDCLKHSLIVHTGHKQGSVKTTSKFCSVFSISICMVSLALVASVVYVLVAQHDCVYGNKEPVGDYRNSAEYMGGDLRMNFEATTLNQTDLDAFVSRLNCEKLYQVLVRLREEQDASEPVSRFMTDRQLYLYITERVNKLNCDVRKEGSESARNRKTRSSSECNPDNVGDGWCDLGCNIAQYRYDNGDCCEQTCKALERFYPCGIVGYDCKLNIPQLTPPSWFTDGNTQLCYQWYPDGDGGQCGGGADRRLCAPVNSYTGYYRDDTDRRPGGCRMRWGIFTSGADDWFQQVQVCYSWYADGDGGQCGGGADSELCAPVNSYTGYYRDDTDGRHGGCRMSWKLKVPGGLQAKWVYDVKLCYQWYPDGDGGQCGVHGTSRLLCASTNQWTPYYRDDTDRRPGGCRMQWGLHLDY